VVRSVPGMARAREISGRPVFCTARLPIALWPGMLGAGSGALAWLACWPWLCVSWPTRTQAAASARVRCRRPTSPAGASLNGQR
jgi:hypothetical protein